MNGTTSSNFWMPDKSLKLSYILFINLLSSKIIEIKLASDLMIFILFMFLKESYIILMDTSLDEKIYNEITTIVQNEKEVLHVDEILSKPVGNSYIIILKISINGNLTLENAHNIGGKIKDDLMNQYDFICDVIMHINPHTV